MTAELARPVVTENPHPAFAGRPHRLELDVTDRAGRRQIVATCSCLGWHASVLVRPRAESAQTVELRELHGDHAAAGLTALVPTTWSPA